MKTFVCLAAFAVGTLSHALEEPADFDVKKALLQNGVDVKHLPELAKFENKSSTAGCPSACESLKSIFGDDQVETQSEPEYTAFLSNFWSAQQAQISPQCIFKPEKALDVSTAVLISRLTKCPFAAKSGGHSNVPGGSNSPGGITISFEKMNKTTPSADRKSVSIQPGQKWFDVYTKLAPYQLTVIGGRVSGVGVGGLTLGGGFSYFSSMYGLACDNVISYELVTATGAIVNVTKNSYPDLFWALRGGGNNFGLAVSFTVNALPRNDAMWGGQRLYLEPEWPALLKAYVNLGNNAKKDPKAHQILSFVSFAGFAAAQLELEYADPIRNASILQEYNSIPNNITDVTNIRSIAELTTMVDSNGTLDGTRQTYWSWTTKLDLELANFTTEVWKEEVKTIQDVGNLTASASFQVITEPMLEKMKVNGGNALGLDPSCGPLMMVLLTSSWTNKADDQRVNQYAARVKNRVMEAAKAAHKSSDYVYMNYASPYQDPVAGYGAANKAKLQAISKKYDPTGVFKFLQPGYFKLDGAPLGKL